MGAVVALSDLVDARRVWRGRAAPIPAGDQPTGVAGLDAALPTAGWPDASITEVLLPLDGIGKHIQGGGGQRPPPVADYGSVTCFSHASGASRRPMFAL